MENEKTSLLTTEEAAEVLGLKKKTLEIWRCTGRYNLPFVRVGRLIRYRSDDIAAWLEKQRCAA